MVTDRGEGKPEPRKGESKGTADLAAGSTERGIAWATGAADDPARGLKSPRYTWRRHTEAGAE